MEIKELYKNINDINISSYLKLNGVKDIEEYIKPTGKYSENVYDYENMENGVNVFKEIFEKNGSVYILCDSGDADGILSASSMYRYMKKINPNWDIIILMHKGKQRGLGDEELFEECKKNVRDLLIIPDSGTNDKEQIKVLTELGTKVIVLDHHNLTTPTEDGVLINCKMGDVDKEGSGAMVTHHFCHALDLEFGTKYSMDIVDLASLSIISDGCDIRSMQNRTYLYYGIMGGLPRIKNKFLRLLVDKLLKEVYTQKDLSFTLVPKINSISRGDDQILKKEMVDAFSGIYDNDEKKLNDILKRMKKAHNNQKDTITDFIKNNADKIDKSNDIIIYISDEVPRTYSGLVAGRIKSSCDNKPTIIAHNYKKNDYCIGSLRSDVPLQKILNESEYVEWCIGHDCQAGIKFKKENKDNIIKYINSLGLSYSGTEQVLASLSYNSIPNKLYGLFEPYKKLFDLNNIDIPKYHIKRFTIYNTDITCKNGVLRFKKDNVTFIRFFSWQETKDKFYMEDKKCKLSIELIVELEINRYTSNYGKTYVTNQAVISEFECKKIGGKSLEDIF